MLFQVIFELSHANAIDTSRTLVRDHPLIRKPQVVAFAYDLHQPALLRFRPQVRRRFRLSTLRSPLRIPSGYFCLRPTFTAGFCLQWFHRELTPYSRPSMFGPSTLTGTYYGLG